MGISAQTENLDAVLEFVNLMADPDAVMVFQCGPQGEFWDLDENGELYVTDKAIDWYVYGAPAKFSNGETYNVGDLKPTWVEVENVLKVDFEDKYTGTSASDQFKFWQDRLDEVDMVSGTASQLTENGVTKSFCHIIYKAVCCLYLNIGFYRIHTECHVGWQCPWGSGPC